METRFCRHCGGPLPASSRPRSLYCSTACRRKYQDTRRKAERKEYKEASARWKVWHSAPVFEDPELPELYGNNIPAEWPELLPCGFPSCSASLVGGPMACQDCPRSLFIEPKNCPADTE